jgi:hypothetical protein
MKDGKRFTRVSFSKERFPMSKVFTHRMTFTSFSDSGDEDEGQKRQSLIEQITEHLAKMPMDELSEFTEGFLGDIARAGDDGGEQKPESSASRHEGHPDRGRVGPTDWDPQHDRKPMTPEEARQKFKENKAGLRAMGIHSEEELMDHINGKKVAGEGRLTDQDQDDARAFAESRIARGDGKVTGLKKADYERIFLQASPSQREELVTLKEKRGSFFRSNPT